MLRNIKDLQYFTIEGIDATIGRVSDLLFEDDTWTARFLVVVTGDWLAGRAVLVSPISIGEPDATERVLPAMLTREQVRASPRLDVHKPVTRHQETELHDHYGYPQYWGGRGMWGDGSMPSLMLPVFPYRPSRHRSPPRWPDHSYRRSDSPRLTSGNDLMRYHLNASDGDIGHVEGLIVDDETWAIRYLVVSTGDWWFGHQVLIASQWVEDIDGPAATVSVALSREAVKRAPSYDPGTLPERDQERRIHEHYDRPVYWEGAKEEVQTSRLW